MKLYDQVARAFVAALNGAGSNNWSTAGGIGTSGSIDFYTTNTVLNSTSTTTPLSGLFGTNARVTLASTPVSPISANGTQSTGSFAFSASSATVGADGIAAYFAVLNTNATSGVTVGNVVFTGLVSTSGGSGEMKFNVVDWVSGDQITITSLTFVQPE